MNEIDWLSWEKMAFVHWGPHYRNTYYTCSKFHSFSTNECLPKKECVLRQCPDCGVEKY